MPFFLAVLFVAVVRAAAAQSPDEIHAASLTKARAALQAGRSREAITLADTVLSARPADGDAAAVKVDALLGLSERDKALDAYDIWARIAQTEQLPLLERIARAELEALTGESVSGIQSEALAALAAHGTPSARARLDKLAWAEPPTAAAWPAIVALARLGEARATERVLRAARESTGSGKAEAIRAIAVAKVAGADAVLRETLAMRDPMLQSAAVDAVVALRLKPLVPEVQKVASGGEQFARFVAAVALADLGARGGEALIDAGLKAPATDMQIKAAGALRARGVKTWHEHVRPLLADPNGLTRFQAAELLLTVDRPAALKVLTAGTTDPNFAIRGEVARILTTDEKTPVSELRRLLRDGAPQVRVLAARAILERDADPVKVSRTPAKK